MNNKKCFKVFKTISATGNESLHTKILKELADGWHLYRPGDDMEISKTPDRKSMTLVKHIA